MGLYSDQLSRGDPPGRPYDVLFQAEESIPFFVEKWRLDMSGDSPTFPDTELLLDCIS